MIHTAILLIAAYLFNIIDYFQTIYAIKHCGISVELNPIMRFLFEHNCAGVVKLALSAILLVIIGLVIKKYKYQAWMAYVVFVFYLMLIIHNFNTLAQMGLF